MSSYPVPGVGTMTSTAYSAQAMQTLWQDLVLQCLGIAPSGPTDSVAYSAVRINWPTQGQPAWKITQDVAFVRAVEVPDAYNAAHEVQLNGQMGTTYPEQTIYTRVWEVGFTFYGPNSFDRARQVKACLYQSFTHDALASAKLYLDTVIGTPRRTPEFFDAQWWERVSFNARLNEQVTDTLVKNTINAVEVIIATPTGIAATIPIDLGEDDLANLTYQQCAGAVPGNTYTATGTVFQVFVSGVAQRPPISGTPLDFSVSSVAIAGVVYSTITLTYATQGTDTVYASTY